MSESDRAGGQNLKHNKDSLYLVEAVARFDRRRADPTDEKSAQRGAEETQQRGGDKGLRQIEVEPQILEPLEESDQPDDEEDDEEEDDDKKISVFDIDA